MAPPTGTLSQLLSSRPSSFLPIPCHPLPSSLLSSHVSLVICSLFPPNISFPFHHLLIFLFLFLLFFDPLFFVLLSPPPPVTRSHFSHFLSFPLSSPPPFPRPPLPSPYLVFIFFVSSYTLFILSSPPLFFTSFSSSFLFHPTSYSSFSSTLSPFPLHPQSPTSFSASYLLLFSLLPFLLFRSITFFLFLQSCYFLSFSFVYLTSVSVSSVSFLLSFSSFLIVSF